MYDGHVGRPHVLLHTLAVLALGDDRASCRYFVREEGSARVYPSGGGVGEEHATDAGALARLFYGSTPGEANSRRDAGGGFERGSDGMGVFRLARGAAMSLARAPQQFWELQGCCMVDAAVGNARSRGGAAATPSNAAISRATRSAASRICDSCTLP